MDHPDVITDSRGTHLVLHRVRDSEADGERRGEALYDVWLSVDRLSTPQGWLGLIETSPDGYVPSHFAIEAGWMSVYPVLDDATLALRAWNDILDERGYWDEEIA